MEYDELLKIKQELEEETSGFKSIKKTQCKCGCYKQILAVGSFGNLSPIEEDVSVRFCINNCCNLGLFIKDHSYPKECKNFKLLNRMKNKKYSSMLVKWKKLKEIETELGKYKTLRCSYSVGSSYYDRCHNEFKSKIQDDKFSIPEDWQQKTCINNCCKYLFCAVHKVEIGAVNCSKIYYHEFILRDY
jgi:hypothetical protein